MLQSGVPMPPTSQRQHRSGNLGRLKAPEQDGLMTNSEPEKLSTILTGVAGEYFVAAELSRRGFVASLTLRNTRGIDILASNVDATKSVGIQVKTCQGTRPAWMLTAKADKDSAENLFYVFVCLPAEGAPSYYVVPRSVVAKQVREDHTRWQATPGKKGQQRGFSNIRKFTDATGVYKDKWNLLGLSQASDCVL